MSSQLSLFECVGQKISIIVPQITLHGQLSQRKLFYRITISSKEIRMSGLQAWSANWINAECEKQGTWNYPIESRFLSLNISLEQSSSSPSWLRSQRSDWTNLSWSEELELNLLWCDVFQVLLCLFLVGSFQNLPGRVKHVIIWVVWVILISSRCDIE